MHLSGAFLIVSEQCNFACKYCYEKEHRTKLMSIETFKKSVDLILRTAKSRNETASITFFGGEPTVNIDLLLEGLKYIVDEKATDEYANTPITVGIITNGGIWNEKVEDFYSKLCIADQLFDLEWSLQLSIDGTPETQNMTRVTKGGQGTSDIVFANVDKIAEVFRKRDVKFLDNPRVAIHPVMNRENLPYIDEMYKYWLDRGIKTMWIMPIHSKEWTAEDGLIYKDKLEKISKLAIEYNAEYSHYNCLSHGREYGCGAGISFGGIDAYGNIYPCHHFIFNDNDDYKKYIIGNINDDNIEDKLEETTQYQFKVDGMKGCGGKECKSCINRDGCYTCWASNLQENNDAYQNSEENCKYLFGHEIHARKMHNLLKSSKEFEDIIGEMKQISELLPYVNPALNKIVMDTTYKPTQLQSLKGTVFNLKNIIVNIVSVLKENKTDEKQCSGDCGCDGNCGDDCKCKNK